MTNRNKLIIEKEKIIRVYYPNYHKVNLTDLEQYFDCDAPSGDKITLDDVFNNQWYLIHELLEINE